MPALIDYIATDHPLPHTIASHELSRRHLYRAVRKNDSGYSANGAYYLGTPIKYTHILPRKDVTVTLSLCEDKATGDYVVIWQGTNIDDGSPRHTSQVYSLAHHRQFFTMPELSPMDFFGKVKDLLSVSLDYNAKFLA